MEYLHAGPLQPCYATGLAGPIKHRAVQTADLRQDVRYVVDPVGERAVDEVVDGQRFPLGVDDEVLLDDSLLLFLGFLVEAVVADRRDVRRGADASHLRPQVVGLVARERRVAGHLPPEH